MSRTQKPSPHRLVADKGDPMDTITCVLLGVLWRATYELIGGDLEHPFAPARIDLAQHYLDMTIDLDWSYWTEGA